MARPCCLRPELVSSDSLHFMDTLPVALVTEPISSVLLTMTMPVRDSNAPSSVRGSLVSWACATAAESSQTTASRRAVTLREMVVFMVFVWCQYHDSMGRKVLADDF